MRMTLRHYVCSSRRVRVGDVQECRFLYAACRPREWLWVDCKGTVGKPTFRGVLTCHDFARFVIFSEISWTEVRSRWRRSPNICLFGRKRPLTGKFSQMFSERIHGDIDPRLVCKFREIWLTGNRQTRALFTSQTKTKFRFDLPLSLLRGSRPKSVRASFRQYTRSAPNFIRIHTLLAEL